MKRLTYELGHKGSGSYEPIQNKDMPANNYITCVNKLGQLEDLLEKYGIPSLEYLEKCIIDHDKYGELGEQIGCPLEVFVKIIIGRNDLIYDKLGEGYIVRVVTEKCITADKKNIGSYVFEISDYKKTWWLRKDQCE